MPATPRLFFGWKFIIFAFVAFAASCLAAIPGAAATDLTASVVIIPPDMDGPERKAAQMLVEEIEKRSFVRWEIVEKAPEGKKSVVYLGRRAALQNAYPSAFRALSPKIEIKPEGYEIATLDSGAIVVAGNDARGVLFGAGRLLRALEYGREKVSLPSALKLSSAPAYPIRGHQLAYRPKTNSYDGWTVAMWEQYIRDFIVFGANSIEIIPPRSDDDSDSPHFNMSQMRMMVELSRLAQEYGINLWIWYPALDKDYGDGAQVKFALKEWGDVLRQLPKVDALFVPGGDPGHTPPKLMFSLLEKQAAQLRELHPKAEMWMSPQGFDSAWMDDFYGLMAKKPAWLRGVAFGPQQRVSVEELRKNMPKEYPIRFYPDITHTLGAQFPVPDWDFAYAVTLNREPINPRPMDHAAIFRRYQPEMPIGFIAYSEGCNDDVNKCVWNSLGWSPDADVGSILREYSRYFIGVDFEDAFAQGLLALERNWRGPLIDNTGVMTTLAQFQAMERAATPFQLRNWRFQQALYRAYYDAYERTRLLAETAREAAAEEELRRVREGGIFSDSLRALEKAERALAGPEPAASGVLRARVHELAEALFQSIHMQLSVPRYQAISVGRGANLDLVDTPLNNAAWLRAEFAAIRALKTEKERLPRIEAVLNWSNPGPGGFYDDLGNVTAQPHLVSGKNYAEDPGFLETPYAAVAMRMGGAPLRVSSRTFAAATADQPLEMHYTGLDPSARYRLRLVYGNEALGSRDKPMMMRLVADGEHELHGMQPKDPEARPFEVDVPAEATGDGELRLTWSRPPGLGGNGRGVQVAEVWLMRAPTE